MFSHPAIALSFWALGEMSTVNRIWNPLSTKAERSAATASVSGAKSRILQEPGKALARA